MAELQASLCVDQAHPGEVVDDGAMAVHSVDVVTPERRLVAVHSPEESNVFGTADDCFHFAGVLARHPNRPDVRNAGVNNHPVPGLR